MSEIKRFYVEKKQGLDNEASALLEELKEIGISGLEGARVLHRYDIEGVSEEFLQTAKSTVIAEPPVDSLYEESFPLAADERYFVKEYLPGQFDQCADSLIQCLALISGGAPNAAYAKAYVLKGDLTDSDLDTIMRYCYNPVDSRIGRKEKSETLAVTAPAPPDVETVGLINLSDTEVSELRARLGLAMSADDLLFCREYFKNDEKRNPTMTEIRVIDTYWSDHCRHTTFLTELTEIEIEKGCYYEPINAAFEAYKAEREALGSKRPVTLMDIATAGMKALKAKGYLDDLDQSDEINACSIEIDVKVNDNAEKWLLMFKNETHNHPTEIEPFGGAATCLGGAIRDPLSGRAYVYQAMRVTGSGDPRKSDTLPGKLPQKKITTEAAHGYSSYGNQIGLATGHVREIYDEGFIAKRMEIGAVIGAAPKGNVVREKPVKGDVVLMAGGRTGRDGCGGATGSSKEHSEESLIECGAEVQKGNAPTERKLQRLFANKEAARLIKKCNDFGAGGVCVAIGELSDSVKIELDKVLKKYEGLDGTELAISESQERMAIVVSRENAERFISLAEAENLEAVPVAEITDDGYMKMNWRGKEIVSIKRGFLDTNGARQTAKAIIKSPAPFWQDEGTKQCEGCVKQAFLNVMGELNACSQKGLIERFDSTIGAGTVLMPFGGKKQLTPEDVMAAKIPVTAYEPLSARDTDTVSVMSAAYDPDIFKLSPFHGGVYSVVESVARLVAAGCDHKKIRLTFQEYFEKMGSPYSWGKPTAALLGAFAAQMGLNTPAIGGKDSMSGTFGDMSVPPVLASFAVSVTDAARVKSAALTGGKKLYVLTPAYDRHNMVDFEDLKQKYEWFYGASEKNGVTAAAAVKKYGIAETVSKMCFGNGVGVKLENGFIERHGEAYLFLPFYGAVVFEAEQVPDSDIEKYGIELLGVTDESGIIVVGGVEIGVEELVAEWEKPLERIFPTRAGAARASSARACAQRSAREAGGAAPAFPRKAQNQKPLVFIPVFPGTNCEHDTARAFYSAGANVETLVFKNLNKKHINESIEALARCVKRAQIIMLPGGFSAGDEPNGSAKFISAVFRNPYVAEAVNEHVRAKDGLIMGICNGFQALIKLGLLPYGEISEITDKSPTIYYNGIGRHVSQIVDVKIVSGNSPFLSAYKKGDIYKVAVSHGEGRFLANEDCYRKLCENGQIATVYVDENGETASERPHNPNGASYGVEGLLSKDGRIFGRMGHPERTGAYAFKNVPGEYDIKAFASAVNYYKI